MKNHRIANSDTVLKYENRDVVSLHYGFEFDKSKGNKKLASLNL